MIGGIRCAATFNRYEMPGNPELALVWAGKALRFNATERDPFRAFSRCPPSVAAAIARHSVPYPPMVVRVADGSFHENYSQTGSGAAAVSHAHRG